MQIQLSSSISSYTVSSEPGVTYYITVRAVNAVGPGHINGPSTIANGEINNHCNQSMSSLLIVPQLPKITSTNTAAQVSTVPITHVTLTSLVTSTSG